mmetsp:Transcript_1662/g.2536  ORF Transcript_1662/g.2536 Transcript_1662/m.2536 type:complete len:303 (-) Transcript_1662:448-1356(-)
MGSILKRSIEWIRAFVVVNGFIMSLTGILLKCYCPGKSFLNDWLACGVRDTVIVLFLTLMTKEKPRLRPDNLSDYRWCWFRLWGLAAPVDAAVFVIALKKFCTKKSVPYSYDYVYFVLTSFLFEIIFDFFHYWIHRACHSRKLPAFVRTAHATHHTAIALRPIATYNQAFLDILLSNAIPALLSLAILAHLGLQFPSAQLSRLWTYKSYVEVAGHAGIHTRASSFPQFVWLPRILGIALHTHDHDLHHIRSHANFSKRFTLWDKVFGTFSDGTSSYIFNTKKGGGVVANNTYRSSDYLVVSR